MALSTYEMELFADLEGELELDGEWEDELEADLEEEIWDRVKQRVGQAFPEGTRRRQMALTAARGVLQGGLPAVAGIVANRIGGHGAAVGAATASAALGDYLTRLLPDKEFEDEFEFEVANAYNQNQSYSTEALMEHLGYAAATSESEAEAEAFIGALLPLAARIFPQVAPTIMRAAPNLIRGLATATRTLHRTPNSRPLVRTIPTIVRRTAMSMNNQLAQAVPVTPKTAVNTLAKQTYGVLSNPQQSAKALRRSHVINQRYLEAENEAEMEYTDAQLRGMSKQEAQSLLNKPEMKRWRQLNQGNTNRTRAENRNQSFGGETHEKVAKGSHSRRF